MTEPDFRDEADRNPRLSGVDLDCKSPLGADLTSGLGSGRKSVGARAPPKPPRLALLHILYTNKAKHKMYTQMYLYVELRGNQFHAMPEEYSLVIRGIAFFLGKKFPIDTLLIPHFY